MTEPNMRGKAADVQRNTLETSLTCHSRLVGIGWPVGLQENGVGLVHGSSIHEVRVNSEIMSA